VTLRGVGFPAAWLAVECDLHLEIARLALRAAQPRARVVARGVPPQDVRQRTRSDFAVVFALAALHADHVGARMVRELVDGAGWKWHGGVFSPAAFAAPPTPRSART